MANIAEAFIKRERSKLFMLKFEEAAACVRHENKYLCILGVPFIWEKISSG